MKLHHVAAATLAVGILLACDITQEHIDQTSERLAQATVAIGSPPSTSALAASVTLQFEHLAGSTWRMIEVEKWPHAEAVVTLGSNRRAIWHVHTNPRHSELGHWNVTDSGFFVMSDSATSTGAGHAGVRVDANTACLEWSGSLCGYVLQRVTP